ncbi:MAG TPA: hypothetical protein VGP12_05670, partial [Nitrosospira sp.]|nr:hypothetical protein [Nitrosospira sp.]
MCPKIHPYAPSGSWIPEPAMKDRTAHTESDNLPTGPGMPRLDSSTGNGFMLSLRKVAQEMEKRRASSAGYASRSLYKSVDHRFSQSWSTTPVHGRPGFARFLLSRRVHPMATHPGKFGTYPLPPSDSTPKDTKLNSYSSVPPLPRDIQYSTFGFRRPVLSQTNASNPRPGPSSEEQSTIKDIYAQHRNMTRHKIDEKKSALAMTATDVKEVLPKFSGHSEEALNALIRSSLGITAQDPTGSRPSVMSKAQQTGTYTARKTGFSNISDQGPPARQFTWSFKSKQSAQSPSGQSFSPSLTSQGFIEKWRNTPFRSREQEVEVSVEYSKKSALGMVSKIEGTVQKGQQKEPVYFSIPGDIQFSGLRQYTLYAHALALARLHDRRATGYTVHVSEFHDHTMQPAPEHKEYAAQAKQIAEKVLHASDEEMDKLDLQLAVVNKGHGWRESAPLDDQMRYAAWEALCAQNTEAKQDLMGMSEDAADLDPVVGKLHGRLHRAAHEAKQAQMRSKDRERASKEIDESLARWVEEARTLHPNDDQ